MNDVKVKGQVWTLILADTGEVWDYLVTPDPGTPEALAQERTTAFYEGLHRRLHDEHQRGVSTCHGPQLRCQRSARPGRRPKR